MQLQEVVYNKSVVFYILDTAIELYSSETAYGWKTFAEIDKQYHYLDDDLINVETACNLWQYLNNRLLTKSEMEFVEADNVYKLGGK